MKSAKRSTESGMPGAARKVTGKRSPSRSTKTTPPPRKAPRGRSPGLPPKPTPAQRKAASALALTPAEQRTAWKTTSTFSPRLIATHEMLGREVRRLFPDAEEVFEYNMRGWKVPRGKPVTHWTGTMDPNWIRLGIAERKQGITIHLWNPFEPNGIRKHAKALAADGYKVMVGCVQYNRKGNVPLTCIFQVLADIKSGEPKGLD